MSQKLIEVVLNGIKQTIQKVATKNMKVIEAKETDKWLEKLFDYNMSGGKHLRARLALNTYQSLSPKATSTDIMNAAKVTSTIELLQTFFLILDDVMDQSTTRRQKLCWYKVDDVGYSAINDGCILEAGINQIILDSIPQHPQKMAIIQCIQNAKFKTSIGQYLDNASRTVQHSNWDRYYQIVEHKTSHYSFYTPIAIGFLLADYLNYSMDYTNIAYKIGYLFQAQDDYLDVYGDPTITGKIGADISNGKCTWLTCKTLELIKNDSIKMKEFENNFGKRNKDNIDTIKQIMDDININEEFIKFQRNLVNELHENIDNFQVKEVKHVFHTLVKNLSGRQT